MNVTTIGQAHRVIATVVAAPDGGRGFGGGHGFGDGIVHQKDLGPKTALRAKTLTQ